MKTFFIACCAVSLGSAVGLWAQAPVKSGDGCAPPPGAIAPALPAKLLTGQGTVHFPITTKSAEAQKFFDQGVAQMHSFWAREAERSFLQAAALDPDAPMPHWGIAMVAAGDWRPRFQIDTRDAFFGKVKTPTASRARDAALKAVELSQVPGKATELEKMYIAAAAARRDPAQKNPDDAFVTETRSLLAKYPDEVEAKTYLALMIMRGFKLPDKTPRDAGSTEAVAILRDLAVKAPDHPGVHHYIIHAFEGSTFAKDAWPSCKRYAELVTNIPHALHMPGHIYSQTGRWDDAIASFSAAAENERGYMAADKFYGSGHHGHNVHYLATAYSFRGDYDKAVAAAQELVAMKENPKEAAQPDNVFTAYSQGSFALLGTLVQFEKWDEILNGRMLPVPTRPREKAWQQWAMGLAHAAKHDVAAARLDLVAMQLAIAEYREKTKQPTPEELAVAQQELEGHIALASRKTKKALRILQAAARGERRLTYTEPPYYPRPVLEALGHSALRAGKMSVAEKAFREALVQYPADYHAQTGLRATLQRNGEVAEAGF